MVRQSKGNISQRKKITREPNFSLYYDVDEQPRIAKLTSHTPNQRTTKHNQARKEFVTRRLRTTSSLLKQRILSLEEGDDGQVITEVLMDLDEGLDSNFVDESPNQSVTSESWTEEEATVEEQLLYFQTKESLLDFDLKGSRNCKQKLVVDQQRWEEQMPELIEAYMDFINRRRKGAVYEGVPKEKHRILVWALFDHSYHDIPIFASDTYNNTSYIRAGYLPFNPLLNRSLISLETLELYHHLFMRCPRLGIQPFTRAICDLQGFRAKNNLSVQISSAYDLYLRLIEEVRLRVREALGRDTDDWRMLNNCPSCQYEVVGEPKLSIRMLIAIDGNNSLKRFQRREAPSVDGELGAVNERMDDRVGGGDYFLLPEQVDLWEESKWPIWPGWKPTEKRAKIPCEDCWSNMNEAKTKRSFGYFDVNGVFAGFCRHSFVILFADMIHTGEQAKYMLALLYRFMSAYQEDRKRRGLPDDSEGSLGVGYDIACGMIDKIARSPLKELANNQRLQMLIGLLHGYAHNRLCQLTFLMLYVSGAGIEDLEVCERYFSHSNELATVTRYMSKFHRHQAIASYAYHRDNFETYHNLSRFISSNYKQALAIIRRSKDTARVMRDLGLLEDGKAEAWLDEERRYLEDSRKPPAADLLRSSYYLALVKLADCQDRLRRSRETFRRQGGGGIQEDTNGLYLTERQMVNAQEMEAKLLLDVQSLEVRLGLRRDERWMPGSDDWSKAKEMVTMAEYHRALDKLEGLVVARIFELSKMNMAGTGYKMRQHIGEAMKKRSKAILKGLEDYNKAAAALNPPRKLLEWNDIINYSYLSEFDLLRGSRRDILNKEWANPAAREAMSEFFKLLRAGEEIDRLHGEIKRLLTYMKEEEEYFSEVVRKLRDTDEPLAYQVWQHGKERSRFNGVHRARLRAIPKLPGFSPDDLNFFEPGVGVKAQSTGSAHPVDQGEEDDDDSEEEEDNADVNERAEAVLAIANDS